MDYVKTASVANPKKQVINMESLPMAGLGEQVMEVCFCQMPLDAHFKLKVGTSEAERPLICQDRPRVGPVVPAGIYHSAPCLSPS